MWCRWAGAALVLLCGMRYCVLCRRHDMTQAARVLAFSALFAQLRTHIALFGTPLSDILLQLPPALWYGCGFAAPYAPSQSPAEALAAGAALLRDEEASRVLSRAVERLGRGTREDQVALCGEVATLLETRAAALRVAAQARGRSRTAWTVAACAAAVIVLW